MDFFKDAKYPFMSWIRGFFTFSIVMTVLAVGIILIKGPNLGIDFKGGSFVHVKFSAAPDLGVLRSAFEARTELGSVEIKQVAGVKADLGSEVMIGVQRMEREGDVLSKVNGVLKDAYPAGGYEILREEMVGPKIGNELKWKAILSVFLSLIAIILYIWFRFQFRFGVASVIPLFHDVFITLGIYVFMGFEVNLSTIAAFLTLIGYSLNDTIVVCDRIRENMLKDQRSTMLDIINRSINETLGRTIITGGTTLLALFALYFISVGEIHDFAFTMIVGIIFGTYSSIGVACGILGAWSPEKLRGIKFKS